MDGSFLAFDLVCRDCSFIAQYRFSGDDANSLIWVLFVRDDWWSHMSSKETYFGRIISEHDHSLSRIVCTIQLCFWMDYEPTVRPIRRSSLDAILGDNQMGANTRLDEILRDDAERLSIEQGISRTLSGVQYGAPMR